MILFLVILLVYSVVGLALCLRVYWINPCRRGHVWEQRDTPSRIYLHCTVCGLESPGWRLFGPMPPPERSRRC